MNPTTDDAPRATFIDATVAEVECLAEGLDVKGDRYRSLLDDFEWTSGYASRFGLVAVDRKTFQRTWKPSARTLAAHAGAGRR